MNTQNTHTHPLTEVWKQYDILIVDDETSILDDLRSLLNLRGFTVHTATSGEKGLELLKILPAKLVISDQKMPGGMNGTQFLCKVKDLYPDVITMVISGFTEPEYFLGAMNDAKASCYIIKPWNKTDLLNRVTQALSVYHNTVREQERVKSLESLVVAGEELMKASKEVETRAGGMAHNIRNMLFSVSAQIDSCKMGFEDLQEIANSGSTTEEKIDRIKKNLQANLEGADLGEMRIEDITDFIDSSMLLFRQKKKDPEEFDLAKLIQNTIQLERKQERFKNIQVHFEARGVDFTVTALKGYLGSNIVELLKNAGDAIAHKNEEAKGNIWVKLEAVNYGSAGEAVKLSIRDDGCGMSDEVRARIFELDFTTKATGSGKGLPELAAMLYQHGGSVDVMSEAGHGTTFTIIFQKIPRK